MKRSVGVYAALLAVFLLGAWFRWTAEPEKDIGDKVVLLQGKAEDIEKIHWKGEKDEAVMERRSDLHGSYVWVTHTRWVEKRPPKKEHGEKPDEAGAEAAVAAEAEPDAEAAAQPAGQEQEAERTAEEQQFKAGETGDKLLDDLSPLLAIRRLDDVGADKLATIGLQEPGESLEVVRKGRTHRLELGGEAYGTRDRYVRYVETGEIFLVDDEALRPLKYARTRLPDRSLFSFEREKVASVTVQGTALSMEAVQENREDEAKAAWVRAEAPDKADEQLDTWMGKALALKGSTWADPSAPPEGLERRFALTLTTGAGESETLDVMQEGADGDWYGQSEHTRGLVKLLRGPTSSLAGDVDGMVER